MISYRPFWDRLDHLGISQYTLIHSYSVSSGSLNALRNNNYVHANTIEYLCNILHCGLSDLVEFIEVADDDVSQTLSGTGKT